MSTHYNAFISYKHAELDNKIAATIERCLEHYHIPRKIQKKTGVKRIERIFRDTDELPITSDLSGTIAEALENADYLIVICSTNTCKSMWVEREIKLFLQNHTQDQILTVLADGEPADVVPEILKNKQITGVNEQGIEETETIPVEPLSCDYRLSAREAKNIELPRLAAALIGCEYNELMDRQRQYKMKRLTAVFATVMAISLSFAGYMIYSNKKVNDSYRASLISQSKYLANEAEKLLAADDRIDALHLAVQALPNEDMPDRPVTTEALQAITKATMAYEPNDVGDVTSIWNYEMPGVVDKIEASAEHNLLAAMDQGGNIKVWDTESNDAITTYTPSSSLMTPSNFKILSDGNIIVVGTNHISCIDPRKSGTIWEENLHDEYLSSKDISITANGDILVALSDYSFRIYSHTDGKTVDEYRLSNDVIENLFTSASIDNVNLSPDNSKIVFTVQDKDQKYGFGVYDTSSGNTIYKDLGAGFIWETSYPTDNELLVAYTTDPNYSSLQYLNVTDYKTERDIILCLNTEDFSEKWSREFESNDISYGTDFTYIKENNSISYYNGNVGAIWDIATGEDLHHYILNSSIIHAYVENDATIPIYITKDGRDVGGYEKSPENKNEIDGMKLFADGLKNFALGKGAFVSQLGSNRIIRYASNTYDKEWTIYEESPELPGDISNSFLSDDIAAVISQDGDAVLLDLYDPNTKKYIKRVTLSQSGNNDYEYKLLGADKEKLYISHAKIESDNLELISVDCETGEFTEGKINQYTYNHNDIPEFANEKIVYTEDEGYQNTYVMIYDVVSGKTDKYRLPVDGCINVDELFYFEKQGYIYSAGDIDYMIDINEKEVYPVEHAKTWDKTVSVSMNEDGTLMSLSDEKDIVIRSVKGTVEKEIAIPVLNVKTSRPIFFKDKNSGTELLLVPFKDGNLRRYNVMTGELVGETKITPASTNDYRSTVTLDPDHSCIYIYNSRVTNILDMDSYLELGFTYNSMGYHSPTDTFPCISKDEDYKYHLGYFRHYTLDDLIKKAKDILKDHEMPQEQKDAYGIG